MQTFLPMISYKEAVEAIDDLRLNKQILEVTQMANAIMDPSAGYRNHPAVIMWSGNVLSLLTYGIYAAREWEERGRKNPGERANALYSRQVAIAAHLGPKRAGKAHQKPVWIGDTDFHESHRSNLIRKDERYGEVWPGTPVDMPYLWPRVASPDSYGLYISAADQKRIKTGERVLPEYLAMLPDGEVVDGDS